MIFDLKKYFGVDKINFVYGPYFKTLKSCKIVYGDPNYGNEREVDYYNFLENNIVKSRSKSGIYINLIQRERCKEIIHYINDMDNQYTESLAKKLDPSICNLFVIATSEGPDWWFNGHCGDGTYQQNLFDIIKEKIPKFFWMLKKTNMHLLIDQMNEGFPLYDCYDVIHNYFEKEKSDISKLHFVTSNLYEQKIYNDWREKNNKTDGFNIIAQPWLENLGWNVVESNVKIQKKYKQNNLDNIKLFNCLNRRGRHDRVIFLNYLNYYNLLENNLVSAGDECKYFVEGQHESKIDIKILNKQNQKNFCNKVPIVQDKSNFQINFANDLNLDLFLNSWFTVVTETFVSEFPGKSMFFSEKIFKPISVCSPFIMVAAPRSLENLKKLGYETFYDIIDESYDQMLDRPKRFKKICELLLDLNKLSSAQLFAMYCKVGEILKHNQNLWKRNITCKI